MSELVKPFLSSFVKMNDEWDTFTVEYMDETFTVHIDGWTCSCGKHDCIHTRMAQEYYESWKQLYDYNSEMAAMLYDDEGE